MRVVAVLFLVVGCGGAPFEVAPELFVDAGRPDAVGDGGKETGDDAGGGQDGAPDAQEAQAEADPVDGMSGDGGAGDGGAGDAALEAGCTPLSDASFHYSVCGFFADTRSFAILPSAAAACGQCVETATCACLQAAGGDAVCAAITANVDYYPADAEPACSTTWAGCATANGVPQVVCQ